MTFTGNRFRLCSSKAESWLRAAVRAAAKEAGIASLYVLPATDSASALQLLVTPLHPSHPINTEWQEPLVLLIISDTEEMAATAAARMGPMYGLTAAECRLVAELADGKTLGEVSQLRSIAVTTLRTQLMAAFGKTPSARTTAARAGSVTL